ncbi:MAG: 3-phosphoshikimate 1-carboxyvinyltransferase, partial [Candidatus Competibacterales bacterium]|nr:3-phosphoshikimate 1-carboxyvinyltransferase [Candidatus Competibacterales bacterium]
MTARFQVEAGAVLRGELRVPGDKSISHRALMLSAIAEGKTEIHGLLEGEDVLNTARALRALGIGIDRLRPGSYLVMGDTLKESSAAIDVGNSGTGMRLLAGILAGQPFPSVLQGDESLSRRPMQRIVTPLEKMGSRITATEGHPPLRILPPEGGLKGIDYASPLASAQVKSCVLLAGLFAAGRTRLREPRPSRDHTERMLQWFGYPIGQRDGWWEVQGPRPMTAPEPLIVPGDVSSAAFWLVAASLLPGSDVQLPSVGINPGRSGVLRLLGKMGADITLNNQTERAGEPVADLRIRSARLRGIEIEPQEVPDAIDEFPILFVAAALAEGETMIRGAEELRAKESDRIAVMAKALRSMGAAIE